MAWLDWYNLHGVACMAWHGMAWCAPTWHVLNDMSWYGRLCCHGVLSCMIHFTSLDLQSTAHMIATCPHPICRYKEAQLARDPTWTLAKEMARRSAAAGVSRGRRSQSIGQHGVMLLIGMPLLCPPGLCSYPIVAWLFTSLPAGAAGGPSR